MVKAFFLVIIMAFIHRLFHNRRKEAYPVDDERRKSEVSKRLKQSFEWHMDAIKDQLKAAEEALKK